MASMPSTVVLLPIKDASDGTDTVPTGSKDMRRNDSYFLNKIAERWMQDTNGAQPGTVYRLEKLPAGYRGFEHQRPDTKHVDRYLYGHPDGIFRSLNELYPHFKHLQDYEDSRGCVCKLCSKNASKSVPGSNSSHQTGNSSPVVPGPKIKPTQKLTRAKGEVKRPTTDRSLEGRLSTSSTPFDAAPRKKQVDEEGTPDVYRELIDKLKEAGPEHSVKQDFADELSPDWRVGHAILQGLFSEWQDLPGHVPRLGEVVLFNRYVGVDVKWDAIRRAFIQTSNGEPVVWEAGVVTQTPVDDLSEADLLGADHQKQNVSYSGFRVEPLSKVSSPHKSLATQHKYVPLHMIRPFSFWKECAGAEDQWHSTIRHALTIASSFCILGKYSFQGTWPEATLFAKSVYIGPELIMLGDVVKLAPLEGKTVITDVMLVTSIRLRFVNLDRASDDDYDEEVSYTTVLHLGGKAFTLNPKRSFAGIAKTPVKPDQHGLPSSLAAYGQWFHVVDPAQEKARLEVPFHRVLGRCHTEAAMRAWFTTATGPEAGSGGKLLDISQGFAAVKEAREFSMQNDSRIKPGKRWFWADTRIEQLDLHEVNGKFVGPKDEVRSSKQVHAWRQALKVLDGKKGGVESYYAAQEKRQEEQKRREEAAVGSFGGMMAAGATEQIHSGTDVEEQDEDADVMEVDSQTFDSRPSGVQLPAQERGLVVDLASDDDDDDDGDDDDSMTG